MEGAGTNDDPDGTHCTRGANGRSACEIGTRPQRSYRGNRSPQRSPIRRAYPHRRRGGRATGRRLRRPRNIRIAAPAEDGRRPGPADVGRGGGIRAGAGRGDGGRHPAQPVPGAVGDRATVWGVAAGGMSSRRRDAIILQAQELCIGTETRSAPWRVMKPRAAS